MCYSRRSREDQEEFPYLDEPRKMQPKMTTRTVVRMSAFRGMECWECTLAKMRLAGSPPSLAKA